MKTKIVSCVLVASLLSYVGCYSTEEITKEGFKASGEPVDITVYTRDSLKYEFSKTSYRIQGDTLTGFGAQRSEATGIYESFVVSVPFVDISSIEADKFSVLKTVILCGVVGFVVVLAIGGASIKGQNPSGGFSIPGFGK